MFCLAPRAHANKTLPGACKRLFFIRRDRDSGPSCMIGRRYQAQYFDEGQMVMMNSYGSGIIS